MVYFLHMKTKLRFQQNQRQTLAPSMQQSIGLLLLPILELNTTITQELEENPLLEIKGEETEEWPSSLEKDFIRISDTFNQNFSYGQNFTDDDILEEIPIEKKISLEDKLLRQLKTELSGPLEIKIGEFVIGNLDENGYLKVTCEEISLMSGVDDMDLIEKVIKIIQFFDPVGVGSRDIKECLLTQIEFKHNSNNSLARKIINDHLKELGNKKFNKIAKKLNVHVAEVKNALKIIASLEPKPARNYRPIMPNIYIKPDITIKKDAENSYQIDINYKGLPRLQINPLYKRMLHKNNLNDDEKNFIREKIKNAINFIKSIEQRGQTIQKIAEYILEKQKKFFENGHLELIPMTLKDVATALNRNESTISRAITNKYVDTPKGTLPIKFFFSQKVSENGIYPVSSRSVKEELKALINAEPPSSPLSDQDIQKYFQKKGTHLARRTINKYRQAMHILPSYLRKR